MQKQSPGDQHQLKPITTVAKNMQEQSLETASISGRWTKVHSKLTSLRSSLAKQVSEASTVWPGTNLG